MTLISILIGIALIILGRKALWLGVFSGSFLGASQLLTYILFDQGETTIWILSAIIAGIALMLYLTLEKAMVVILGAVGGGFLAFSVCTATSFMSTDTFPAKFAVFVAGGLFGILLMKIVFEWTMKAFTALIGAFLISSFLVGQPIFQLLALVLLTIIGLAIQGNETMKFPSAEYPDPYTEPAN
jgi:hypothetical protein